MKLTLFGATGQSGRQILKMAVEAGHEVTVMVRDKDKLELIWGNWPEVLKNRVVVMLGDVLIAAAVAAAIKDSDAVISTIGHVRSSAADMQTQGIKNIISGMKIYSVKRLISLTGAGVPVEGDHPGFIDSLMNLGLKILTPNRIQDGIDHVEEIKKSDLDWTVVRTPLQVNSAAKGYNVGKVGDSHIGFKVSREDIAQFMLDILRDNSYIHDLPVISSK